MRKRQECPLISSLQALFFSLQVTMTGIIAFFFHCVEKRRAPVHSRALESLKKFETNPGRNCRVNYATLYIYIHKQSQTRTHNTNKMSKRQSHILNHFGKTPAKQSRNEARPTTTTHQHHPSCFFVAVNWTS